MKITKIAAVPFIRGEAVRLGTMAYIVEKNQASGFAGFVSAVGSEEVTLTGVRGGRGTTVKLSAAQLSKKEYEELRFAEEMETIKTESASPWTEDIDMMVIDVELCKPSHFIMYRKSAGESYTNGVIATVDRGKMTICTVSGGKSAVVTVTLGEIEREGFEVEVYPTLAGGASAGENYGTVTYLGEGA